MAEDTGAGDEQAPPPGKTTPAPTLPFPADAPELAPGPRESWIRRLARRLLPR